MGYTHYWYRPEKLDADKFKKASKDCSLLAKSLNIPVQFEYDIDEPPVFSENTIRFNGIEEDGHETFSVEQLFQPSFRQETDGKLFTFCKTARKPYDTLVTGCLTILKHYFGDDFIVKSDGRQSDWEDGVREVWDLFHYGDCPLENKCS